MAGALTESDSGQVRQHMIESIVCQMNEQLRPSVLFQPRVFKDRDMWCCLRGENLIEGVVAFGETPDKAARAFDREWLEGGKQ